MAHWVFHVYVCGLFHGRTSVTRPCVIHEQSMNSPRTSSRSVHEQPMNEALCTHVKHEQHGITNERTSECIIDNSTVKCDVIVRESKSP